MNAPGVTPSSVLARHAVLRGGLLAGVTTLAGASGAVEIAAVAAATTLVAQATPQAPVRPRS